MIASSVVLSRALKQNRTATFTIYSFRMQEMIQEEHSPLSVPQGRKECNGAIRCANTNTSTDMLEIYNKSQLSFSETV